VKKKEADLGARAEQDTPTESRATNEHKHHPWNEDQDRNRKSYNKTNRSEAIIWLEKVVGLDRE